MTISLWKRNVIGAAISAAALVATTAFVLKPEWDRYERTVQPTHTAGPGQDVVVDGQTWTVRNVYRSMRQPGSSLPPPEGTVVAKVVVERSGPAEPGIACNGFLLDNERSWRAVGPPCGARQSMEWSFLIPATAEPTAVDVRKLDGSILIRFELS
jgi:hypothetical protein